MPRIPIAGPSITQKEIDYVTDAVTNAWYDQAGRYHSRFEAAFAAYTGRKHAMALPSCTSALHLSLLGLGIGPGDEVVVPDATWIASSAAITYVGASPRFADIDPNSWCLSAESLERTLTPRTRAVIVVDLYGNLPDMDAILEVAERHGLAVVEDAAEAIGSEYHGRKAGSFGATSTFSFHGSKTLTTGEGGMLVTNDTALFERCSFLRDHGRPPGDRLFWNTEVAYKYKMSSLQAALGLAQLERIEELVQQKREIFAWYQEALAGEDRIQLNHEAPGVKNTYWMVTAVVDEGLGLTKDRLMSELGLRGIDTRPFFHPLSSIPAYAELPEASRAREANRVAYDIASRAVNLPSALNLTPAQVGQVAEALLEIVRSV